MATKETLRQIRRIERRTARAEIAFREVASQLIDNPRQIEELVARLKARGLEAIADVLRDAS